VNECLYVFDGGSERERPNAASFAIEGHHIVTARWAVLKHEHLAAAFITQIEQLIASAP
jgi:hypothetical protein